EAIPHYELVLARYPDRLPERVNLVTGLVAFGRLPEAVVRLEEASRTSPASAQVEYFEWLTRTQPAAPVGWLGLFLVATRAGDSARAQSAHATLAPLHPELASLALRATTRPPAPVSGPACRRKRRHVIRRARSRSDPPPTRRWSRVPGSGRLVWCPSRSPLSPCSASCPSSETTSLTG